MEEGPDLRTGQAAITSVCVCVHMCVRAQYTSAHACMCAHVCICVHMHMGGRGLQWGGMGAPRMPRAQSSQVPHPGGAPSSGCDRRIFLLTTFSLSPHLCGLALLLLACPVSLARGVWGLSWGKYGGGGGGLTTEMLGPAGERHRAGPWGTARPHSSHPCPSPDSELESAERPSFHGPCAGPGRPVLS